MLAQPGEVSPACVSMGTSRLWYGGEGGVPSDVPRLASRPPRCRCKGGTIAGKVAGSAGSSDAQGGRISTPGRIRPWHVIEVSIAQNTGG